MSFIISQTIFKLISDDFDAIEDEVTEEEMGLLRIPNEGDKDRIFHTHDKWELIEYGFFNNRHPSVSIEQCRYKYKEHLSDLEGFRSAIYELFEACPNSCEHNLTNRSLNRIAWIGQASVAFRHQIPSIFCSGFNLLSIEEQEAANIVAFDALNCWLTERGISPVTIEEALQINRQVELY